MRLQSFVCVAIAASAIAAAGPAAADTAISDPLCPRAVPKLVVFNAAAASKDVLKIAVAARDAADAYRLCTSDAQVAKGVAVEPTVNYDKTRNAQYLVVEARALAATGNVTDAVIALKTARHLADDVFAWLPESQTWHASATTGAPGMARDDGPPIGGGNSAARNTDHNGSRYKDAALQIRTAADEELAKLSPAASPAPAKPS